MNASVVGKGLLEVQWSETSRLLKGTNVQKSLGPNKKKTIINTYFSPEAEDTKSCLTNGFREASKYSSTPKVVFVFFIMLHNRQGVYAYLFYPYIIRFNLCNPKSSLLLTMSRIKSSITTLRFHTCRLSPFRTHILP